MSYLRYHARSVEGRRALHHLADGYRGILWSVIGDLDYMAKTLLLPRSTLASGPCALCKCTGSGATTWMDFRPTATWRTLLWTAHDWRNWPGRSQSPLFQDEGFSPFLISLDWMHCKYLGHDQHTFGSILSLLVRHVMAGNPQENLKQVWNEIQKFYKENNTPVRFRYLNRLSMFERKSPQYPKLRGKAAEVKHLAGALEHCWKKIYNPNLQVNRQIALYLKLNLELEDLLTVNRDELALPPDDAAKFEQTCTAMLLLLTQIAEHFIADRFFNITQKAHFLQHISLLSRFLSPRLTWCFMGEDMQKRMSGLAKSCVNGQRPGQTIGKMFNRYRLALQLQFEAHKD